MPSTSILLALVLVVLGLLIFAIGSLLARPRHEMVAVAEAVAMTPPPTREITWTRAVLGDDAPIPTEDERREMYERLAFLGESWCEELLAQAREEEPFLVNG